jgi:hypothetical protein
MALLPSRKIFDASVPPLPTTAALRAQPAAWAVVFLIGAATILAGALIALTMVFEGELGLWLGVPFLAGLLPAFIFSQRCPAASAPILFITALAPMGVVWQTEVAPLGEIIELASPANIPAGLPVAGYRAPGWRIDAARAQTSDIRARHGSAGDRTVAPLLPPDAKPDDPVALWVVGYAYKSGKIGLWHPAHWPEPGEFARVVGNDLWAAQETALSAAKAQGLRTGAAPIIVVRVDSALGAENAQRNTLVAIVGAVLALWLIASFASVRLEARARRRKA